MERGVQWNQLSVIIDTINESFIEYMKFKNKVIKLESSKIYQYIIYFNVKNVTLKIRKRCSNFCNLILLNASEIINIKDYLLHH